MSTKILRPIPTFEQVIRLPDPVVNLPERLIEVSRPDPNTFDEHFDALLKHNAAPPTWGAPHDPQNISSRKPEDATPSKRYTQPEF